MDYEVLQGTIYRYAINGAGEQEVATVLEVQALRRVGINPAKTCEP